MPKCLNCDNTVKFSYTENSYNEAIYDEDGNLADVLYKEYHDVQEGTCMECGSNDIEGQLQALTLLPNYCKINI